MKKNKLFIAGLVTVFIALCSLTLVSSTWAKYTSTASGQDSARVARWGFSTTSVNIDNLFKQAYDSSVQSTVDVIAPGTSNSVLIVFEPTGGAPEVSYRLSYEVDFVFENEDLKTKLDKNSSFEWTIQIENNSNLFVYQKVEDFEKALESLSADYEPGELPNSGRITIGWRWDFDGPLNNFENDALDTELGNYAEELKTVKLTIKVTATQID